MFGFLAQLLAWCYDVIPNYGVAITLFTLIVMVAVTPLTIKGMRSMAEMARLQPEMKKLQDQYKNDRVKMNEEMQALFKEHKVNPLGGCLPTVLPLPIFFIIFRLLRELNAKSSHHIFDPRRIVNGLPSPKYLAHSSSMYQHLVADGGKMVSFGMDLGKSAKDPHGSFAAAIPFYTLIVIMTVSQYAQQRQMNARNPQAANANPQMKMTMQLFPAFYALISLTIPASVVFYLLISGLFRMAQNSLSYKYDARMRPPGADKGVIDTTAKPKGGSPPSTSPETRRGGPKLPGGAGNGGRKPLTGGTGAKPPPEKKPGNGKGDPTDAPESKRAGADAKGRPTARSTVNAKPPGSRPSGRVTPRGSGQPRSRRER